MNLFIKWVETRIGSVLIELAGHITLGSVVNKDKAAWSLEFARPGELYQSNTNINQYLQRYLSVVTEQELGEKTTGGTVSQQLDMTSVLQGSKGV